MKNRPRNSVLSLVITGILAIGIVATQSHSGSLRKCECDTRSYD